jgi:hypothetical protein
MWLRRRSGKSYRPRKRRVRLATLNDLLDLRIFIAPF